MLVQAQVPRLPRSLQLMVRPRPQRRLFSLVLPRLP
jgi:hypothetical protein